MEPFILLLLSVNVSYTGGFCSQLTNNIFPETCYAVFLYYNSRFCSVFAFAVVVCETPNIKNANRVEGKPPPYGYKNFVRYQCIEGYTMTGSGYLVCEVNGWNPPPPECICKIINLS